MGKQRILSGVQPTGNLHLGNYLGAIGNWVEAQSQYDNFFCVVDLHAITVPHDPSTLKENTYKTAALYLACGLDLEHCKIFVQSHICAHSELTWLLNCVTPLNWLERMIQFKEKAVKQGENVSVGLLDYPVLMAADILLYDADKVPVGEDQKQHIELTRDIAVRINDQFGGKGQSVLKIPEPLIR
ncbi:MAG: tryptophan--tRNA ligase, partial [Symploca sp. SIO1C4]|nr:tryptophan--tRNA ligase [Symploca sp. SIO1C4]